MNVKPLGARAIVRRILPGETRKGEIIMPDSVKAKHRWGEVVAVGDMVRLAPGYDDGTQPPVWPVPVGSRVLLPLHACAPNFCDRFDHDGEELLVLDCKELLAVLGPS